MKIHFIFVLDFFYSLSFLFSPLPAIHGSGLPYADFLPWDRSQYLQVFQSPKAFISSPSVVPLSRPLSPFLIQLAHPTQISPAFHPIRSCSTRRVTWWRQVLSFRRLATAYLRGGGSVCVGWLGIWVSFFGKVFSHVCHAILVRIFIDGILASLGVLVFCYTPCHS